ncbi:MAG TPA: PGF-CTERM sorting domain-containing protein [Methanocorpusculum sp.]|nr:PGF-CTERM sorting domain-containing protein [Methanocorpusculum sp.]HJK79499.1 PGF-CTERM sorting domain-containing protein [Methanocorpusculum sp.]
MFTVIISGKSLLQPPPVVPATTPSIQTPGFGAFIAHAGLGTVALLVLRRN